MKQRRKVLKGIVVSSKMRKTIVVEVERLKRHPLYQKVIRVHKKYKVHDEKNEAKEGDEVSIIEIRPLSRHKRFRLLEILKRGQ